MEGEWGWYEPLPHYHQDMFDCPIFKARVLKRICVQITDPPPPVVGPEKKCPNKWPPLRDRKLAFRNVPKGQLFGKKVFFLSFLQLIVAPTF